MNNLPQPPVLELCGVHKQFGPVVAVDSADFKLGENEIVGLIGDNGAGKSTLVKLLSGVIQADSGTSYFKGQVINPNRFSVAQARKLGVETVHQERALGESQPLWRNIFVGRHKRNRLGFIDVAFEKAETERILRDFVGLRGHGVNADAEVSVLSGGERQGLAIGRAMYFDASVIILDEPTTALSLGEVDKVLSFVASIKKSGKSAIVVSHNMRHIHQICDRFVIMDRGRITHDLHRDEATVEQLTALLTGIACGDIA